MKKQRLHKIRQEHQVSANPVTSFFTTARPLRVLTMNILNFSNSYEKRQVLLRKGIQQLDPDVMAFQEAGYDGDRNQVAEMLAGLGYHVAHQFDGHTSLSRPEGNAVASRWPMKRVETLSLQITERCQDYPYCALMMRIAAPEPVGQFLFGSCKTAGSIVNTNGNHKRSPSPGRQDSETGSGFLNQP